ncbi:hypothetical protein [Lelliottia wanjuensis]|uniref:Pectate lyase superfamily protein domain-containing protein n=1 Tax=Lelliottia wanjuensis TaxID=3050585 RepID=A0AAP4D5K8_9ENTR|nr:MULTISPECIES: hypothetical protein [unclassified Lelliottia]MDK9364814.1 hypothetical protein [Lelliottia sp. V106_12]MDK9616638.1 hypothetical protein [Lelliottia sp. V106_9]
MSISDTSKAQRYASVAEVAAAQAKLYADKLEHAPDYAEQSAASAAAAASSALVAVSAESVVNNLAISASESATQAAASAAEAGNAASAAIGQCVRVPEGELISELPDSSSRQNTVVTFVDDGSLYAKPISDFATLDENGKIPVSQIPAIALTEPFVVSSQAEMLALDAQVGDIAKRTDLGYSFCLAAAPASSLSNWVQLTDDVLSQLGQSSGAGMVGALDESSAPSTVQAELNKRPSLSKLAQATSAALIGVSSGGNVQSELDLKTSKTYVDSQVAGLVTKASLQGNLIFATADAGIPNDGSDVSTQVSTFLNANKGKFIVFDSGTYQFAGVVLSGTGWEGTTIYFKGKHLMKPDTTGTNTPGYGAFIGIVIPKDVNGINLFYKGDGNRTLQYDREHIFNVAVLGATNISIPQFECNEIRGDGLYVNLPDQNTASNFPTNIMIGNAYGKNSSQDGRNLVSIVSCLGGSVTNFRSENIGGTVGGVTQPGGIDIEPNANTACLIRDFTVHNAEVINAGLVGIGFMSDPSLPPKIQNCHILNAVIRGTGAPRMYGTIGCSIKLDSIGLNNNGLMVEGAQNSSATLNINGCYNGVMVGTFTACTNCTITAFVSNVRNAGAVVAQAESCRINITVSGFSDPAGNNIGVWLRNLNELASCVHRSNFYQVICPNPTNTKKAMDLFTSANPITFLGVSVIRESNFIGFSNYTNVLGAAGRYLAKEGRMPGLTDANGVPSDGTWKKSDFVFYNNPSTTNKFYGFYRITDGSGNVNGTDWGTVSFS